MSPSTTTTPSSLRRRLLALGLGGLLLGGTTGMVLAGDDEQEKRASTKVEKIDRAALRSLAAGNLQFAFNFYRAGIHPGENLVLSPYGISECFSLLYAGSSEGTARVLEDLFHYPEAPERILASFGNLRRHIAGRTNEACRIDIASSCWADERTPVAPGYARDLESGIDGEIFSVDFSQGELVQAEMNAWVDENTNGLIKEAPGPVSPADLLVLMNTVCLDAAWEAGFEKSVTKDRPFRLVDGRTVDVPTMHQERRHRYAATEDAQIVELPYAGGTTSMLIILPREGRELSDLEKKLDPAMLAGWDRTMKTRKVELRLPRFELASQLDLKQLLAAMTSTGLFGALDLGRMLEATSVMVTDASQDAVIKVDEDGTEAAALTTVTLGRSARPTPEAVEVSVDRPFMYLVRDHATDTIYFMGRVVDPRGSASESPRSSTP